MRQTWKAWIKRQPAWVRWLLGTSALALVAILALRLFAGDLKTTDEPTFAAQRGPLTISVLESGTIQAQNQVTLKNEVEGRTTILYLIKEGTRVKAKELLVELDASALQDQLIDRQIKLQNAEADFIRSRETLEVTRNQAKSDVERAELAARFAAEDLTQYQQGEYPKEIKESESRIALAQEELRRAEEKLEWSKVLFKEKYVSQTELQADELAGKKAQLDLELAVSDRDLLRDYSYKRKLAELKSEARQTRMALERARRKASADVVQAEADLRAKQSEFQREQSKLDKVKDQIAKTSITAPIDGMVVYATSAERHRRGNAEPLAEGQEVRERQDLIILPATDSIMAEVKIHESSLEKVTVGLPVRVTVDALPGRSFTGKVATIALLPDAVSIWLNPDLKVYNTEIHLEGSSRGLRTGMSCQAEILIEEYADSLFVPVQAVTKLNGKLKVFVVDGDKLEPREVQIGLDNNRMVKIDGGLREGERVLLNPPLAPGGANGAPRTEAAKASADKRPGQ